MRGRAVHRRIALLALLSALPVGLLSVLPVAAARESRRADSQGPPAWSATNLFAPITGLFLGGPGYWYSARSIEIETTPPGAVLDLFYVRSNFQKGYEQADAPATVILPSRIEAGPRDSLTIRALLDGYRQREVHVRVRSRDEKVHIELEPLANALVAMTHSNFAGRTTLDLPDQGAAHLPRAGRERRLRGRAHVDRQASGDAAGTLEGVQSSMLKSVKAQQLGEDLVVRVSLTDAARARKIETRSRQSFDPVRGLHVRARLVAPDDGSTPVQRAQAALRGDPARRGVGLRQRVRRGAAREARSVGADARARAAAAPSPIPTCGPR